MELAVFIICSAIVLSGALGVLIANNPVHAALFLVETLFGIAVLFILLDATFLAAVQVVVYAGAIVILFLFVIMLLGVDRADDLGIEPISGQRPLTIVIGSSILGLMLTPLLISVSGPTGTSTSVSEVSLGGTNTKNLGGTLFHDHLFAVELTALLLTVAIVGAIALARRLKGPLQPIPVLETINDEGPSPEDNGDVD